MIRKKIQLLFETEVKVIINMLLPESCWEMDSGVSQRVKDRTLKGGEAGLVFKRRICWRYWGSL